jgi:hypothetical protein
VVLKRCRERKGSQRAGESEVWVIKVIWNGLLRILILLRTPRSRNTVRKGTKVAKVRDKASLPDRYSPVGSTSRSLTEYRAAAPLASRKSCPPPEA